MKIQKMNYSNNFVDFNTNGIDPSSWSGFGWFGELYIELNNGKRLVVSAGGTATGNHGGMNFKIFSPEFTQAELKNVKVIAYKTINKVIKEERKKLTNQLELAL